MDVAGVVVGSIGLAVSLLLATYQLQRTARFRKPLFKLEDAHIPVEGDVASGDKAYVKLGDGKVMLNARGANRPIAIRQLQMFFTDEDGRARGGYGSSGVAMDRAGGTGIGELPFLVELLAERWTRFHIDVPRALTPVSSGRPRRLRVELYLQSPEEVFIVPVPLVLDGSGVAYGLDDVQERHRLLGRTIWRSRGIRDRLRRLTRFRL